MLPDNATIRMNGNAAMIRSSGPCAARNARLRVSRCSRVSMRSNRPGRGKEAVALLHDARQRGAAAQGREDLAGGLRRPDECLAQLCECEGYSNSDA